MNNFPTFSVASFSINYKKTHNSRLKYGVKYDLYKITHKNLKKLKLGFLFFFRFLTPKKVFEAIFHPWLQRSVRALWLVDGIDQYG